MNYRVVMVLRRDCGCELWLDRGRSRVTWNRCRSCLGILRGIQTRTDRQREAA